MNIKTGLLVYLSKNWSKNRGKNYPQTWYYMPPRWSRRTDAMSCQKPSGDTAAAIMLTVTAGGVTKELGCQKSLYSFNLKTLSQGL